MLKIRFKLRIISLLGFLFYLFRIGDCRLLFAIEKVLASKQNDFKLAAILLGIVAIEIRGLYF